MKIVLIFVLSLVTITGGLLAQCNPYFDLAEGSKWEITNYNGKGKFQGKQQSEIKALNIEDNGWKATVAMALYDKKSEIVYNKDIEMACDNGIVNLDMTRLIPDEQLKVYEDMNMKVDVDNVEIPKELEVGMTLDDGSVTISGDLSMTITVTITDRKVEGMETVITPAGSFECYKISYSVGTKMVMNVKSKGVDFIAKGVGIVRNETYNKSGKLTGYSELTSR